MAFQGLSLFSASEMSYDNCRQFCHQHLKHSVTAGKAGKIDSDCQRTQMTSCSDWAGGKDRLLETCFKINYKQSSWFYLPIGRGRKGQKSICKYFSTPSKVWCFCLATVDMRLKTSLICLVVSCPKMSAESVFPFPFVEGNQGRSSLNPVLGGARRRVMHVPMARIRLVFK